VPEKLGGETVGETTAGETVGETTAGGTVALSARTANAISVLNKNEKLKLIQIRNRKSNFIFLILQH